MLTLAKITYLEEDLTQPFFLDLRNNIIDDKALEDVSKRIDKLFPDK